MRERKNIYVVGSVAVGKTTFLKSLYEMLSEKSISYKDYKGNNKIPFYVEYLSNDTYTAINNLIILEKNNKENADKYKKLRQRVVYDAINQRDTLGDINAEMYGAEVSVYDRHISDVLCFSGEAEYGNLVIQENDMFIYINTPPEIAHENMISRGRGDTFTIEQLTHISNQFKIISSRISSVNDNVITFNPFDKKMNQNHVFNEIKIFIKKNNFF